MLDDIKSGFMSSTFLLNDIKPDFMSSRKMVNFITMPIDRERVGSFRGVANVFVMRIGPLPEACNKGLTTRIELQEETCKVGVEERSETCKLCVEGESKTCKVDKTSKLFEEFPDKHLKTYKCCL